MHVLWVNEFANFRGGCERHIYDTVRLLHEHGIKSTLLYDVRQETNPKFLRAFDAAFPMVDVPLQIAEIKPDLIYAHRISGIDGANDLLESHVPTLRFYHDHSLFCPREHKYSLLKRETCTKKVGLGCLTCCGGLVKPASGSGLRIVTPGKLIREQKVNQKFLKYVVGSTYMAGHLKLHGFDEKRIAVLPLYTAEPTGSNDPPPERERDLLMFVGQLTTGKGVDTLLSAMALVKAPVRLQIYGTGKFEEAYRMQAKRLGLDSRVDFCGSTTPANLTIAYRKAGCVVVPSRSPETFGLVGPEAMSCGAPVIASQVGGTGEWLDEGVTGLGCPSNNPAALAAAIDKMYSDQQMAHRMSVAARARYKERFTPECHIRSLIELFESVVNAKQEAA
jgi:glycosyltransferase involved in cell wall biosynthesis